MKLWEFFLCVCVCGYFNMGSFASIIVTFAGCWFLCCPLSFYIHKLEFIKGRALPYVYSTICISKEKDILWSVIRYDPFVAQFVAVWWLRAPSNWMLYPFNMLVSFFQHFLFWQHETFQVRLVPFLPQHALAQLFLQGALTHL